MRQRFVGQLRFNRIHAHGNVGFCHEQVDDGKHLDIMFDRIRRSANASRKLLQHASDFALFFQAQGPHAVVRFERRERLNEQRLA